MNSSFEHSGRLGGIIYSLALVRKMAVIHGKSVEY
jgi:hypothetical protein